jgi:hypothetical protein
VDIDIRPRTDKNVVNSTGRGVVPIVVFGDADFEVSTVDVATLSFGPGEAPSHSVHVADVDGDGFDDLVTYHRGIEAALATDEPEACLQAMTIDGTPILGCDTVRHIGPRAMQ